MLPLVIVIVTGDPAPVLAPPPEQPPLPAMLTGSVELACAATLKEEPNAEEPGAAVSMVIVCAETAFTVIEVFPVLGLTPLFVGANVAETPTLPLTLGVNVVTQGLTLVQTVGLNVPDPEYVIVLPSWTEPPPVIDALAVQVVDDPRPMGSGLHETTVWLFVASVKEVCAVNVVTLPLASGAVVWTAVTKNVTPMSLLSGAKEESEMLPSASAMVVMVAGWSKFELSVIKICTGRPGSQPEPVKCTGVPGA